nr:hypothetical protein CFP56_67713 [Quercus suber]
MGSQGAVDEGQEEEWEKRRAEGAVRLITVSTVSLFGLALSFLPTCFWGDYCSVQASELPSGKTERDEPSLLFVAWTWERLTGALFLHPIVQVCFVLFYIVGID